MVNVITSLSRCIVLFDRIFAVSYNLSRDWLHHRAARYGLRCHPHHQSPLSVCAAYPYRRVRSRSHTYVSGSCTRSSAADPVVGGTMDSSCASSVSSGGALRSTSAQDEGGYSASLFVGRDGEHFHQLDCNLIL